VIDRTDELDYNPEPVEPSQDEDLQEHSLEQITTLVDLDAESPIVNMVWRDSDNDFDSGETGVAGEVLSLDRSGRVTMWDVEAAQPVRTEMVKFENQMTPPRLVWDPHSHRVAITVGSDVKIVDWRTDSPLVSTTAESFKAHRFGVADVDFNPNKPFVLATAGLDGLIKFWDTRNVKTPLLSARGGHSNYAWNVKYNPFHDQLVLSTGTDAVVNLWRVSTISSAPLLAEGDDASETSAPNVRVARYEHSDSVYGVAWAAADAWLYASVGYDGKMIVNHVPSKEKYKILL
jgi:WD40 repeat protein